MKTLLHICCAPCSVHCVDSLRAEGIEPVGFWYNPNIHPYTEYVSRRDCLRAYAADIGLELVERDEYGLRDFVRAVAADIDRRCRYCYAVRLEAAAAYAAAHGFESFSTTLLVSPYQDHELLRRTGEAAAARHGITFLYRDFRPGFRAGQARARALGLYLQKYCGCVFSEEERYLPKPPPPEPDVDEPVTLAPHDGAWAGIFAAERARILEALSPEAPAVEHIGSTAVPGLVAKPIVDILVGVPSMPPKKRYISALKKLGYTHMAKASVPERVYFIRRDETPCNLHIVQHEGKLWREDLRFRDRLRADGALAARYGALKQQAVANGADRLLAYSGKKADFVAAYSAKKLPRG